MVIHLGMETRIGAIVRYRHITGLQVFHCTFLFSAQLSWGEKQPWEPLQSRQSRWGGFWHFTNQCAFSVWRGHIWPTSIYMYRWVLKILIVYFYSETQIMSKQLHIWFKDGCWEYQIIKKLRWLDRKTSITFSSGLAEQDLRPEDLVRWSVLHIQPPK